MELNLKQNILRSIVLSGAYLALLTPLFMQAYNVGDLMLVRASWFFGFVSIMALAWFLLALSDRRFRLNMRHPIVLSLTLFLLILLVNLIFSVDPFESFWSSKGRMTGVISYIYFWLWFVSLVSVLRKDDWMKLLKISVLIAVIVSVRGVIDWTMGGFFLDSSNRVQSIIGNPLFLAQYVLPHAFLALYFAIKQKKMKNRTVWFVIFSFLLFSIVLTVSRAAYLAIFASAFLMIVIYALYLPRKKKIILLSVLVVLIVSFTVTYFVLRLPNNRIVIEPNAHYIISRIFYNDIKIDRFYAWKVAGVAMQDRPVFGWGLNTFAIVFDKNYVSDLDGIYLEEPFFDRVHNQILEVGFSLGLVGIIFWSLIWISAWYSLFFSGIKETLRRDGFSKMVLMVMFVGVFVQLFFLFDVFISHITLYMMLAYSAFITKDVSIGLFPRLTIENSSELRLRSVYFAIAIGALIPLELFLSIYPLQAVNAADRAKTLIRNDSGDPRGYIDTALKRKTYVRAELIEDIFGSLHSWAMVYQVHTKEAKSLVLPLALELEAGAYIQPNNYRAQWFATNALELASYYDKDLLLPAEALGERARSLAPGRPEIYNSLGNIAIQQGDPVLALEYFQQSMERTALSDDRLNGRRVSNEFRYALAYLEMDRLDLAFEKLESAQELGLLIHNDARFILRLDDHYVKGDHDKEVLDYITVVLSVFTNHPEVLEAGARIFSEAENSEAADFILKMLAAVDQEQSDQLRSELGL